MRSFRTYADAMGMASDVLEPSDTRHVIVLAAGVAKSVAVPAGAGTVLFAATGPFWVRYGGAAALPAADDLSGQAPELSPAARRVEGVATLGLVAPADAIVSLAWYR